MKYLSLFSGIGGFELGIQQAYEDRILRDRGTRPIHRGSTQGLRSNREESTTEESPPTCIGYSEIDKYAIQVYNKQFNHKNYGDITTIEPKELPDFDCLVGGFPCQSFSIAGKRKGFEDTRGTLFFDIARILRDKTPRLVVLENVKGLLSHDKGATFQTILGVLADLGYFVEWQVLNSKNFGVPQNRERVFIIGYFGGFPRRKVFPIGESNQANNEASQQPTTKGEVAQTITATYWKGGKGSQIVKPVLTPDRPEKRQNGRRFKEDGKPSFTLTSQDKHGVMVDSKIRRLTPTECERLQGFPDNWTAKGINEKEEVDISDTQRYKMCGNAVTTNVIKEIFNKLDI